MNTEGMMPLEQAKQLKPDVRVRVMVSGRGDAWSEAEQADIEQEFPAGEVLTVTRVDTFPAPQGFAVTVVAPNGVVNVFDEADFGGLYPFSEVLPPLSEFLPPLDQLRSLPSHTFTVQERDIILAALRVYQLHGAPIPADINDIATCGGEHPALSDEEIDDLCERINA